MEDAAGTASRKLKWVRMGVLLSGVVFFVPIVAVVLAGQRVWLVAAVLVVFLCIPHLLTLPRLFGKEERIKNGLKGAGDIAAGGIVFWGVAGGAPALLALISIASHRGRFDLELLTAALAALAIGTIGVLPHWMMRRDVRAAHAARWPDVTVPRHVMGGLGVGLYFLAIALWGLTVIPGMMGGRRERYNESSAAGSLRTINAAAVQYREEYKNGYPPYLAALALPANTALSGEPMKPTCAAADLIDTVLGSGQKNGYIFTYTPGPPVKEPASGCPPGAESYTVTARPRTFGETGKRSFFTDQRGVIRATSEDRAAKASDPPLD